MFELRGVTTWVCIDCGAVLTEEERHYYENRCESCEWEQHERIEAWRHGADDPELDRLFSAPEPVKH